MLKKCTYNSHYIAYYALVWIDYNIQTNNMRHKETQLYYHRAYGHNFNATLLK